MNDPEEAEIARWFEARSERVVETACARVFLAGARAFKVKRHVDLGYVDFTTLERRKWAVERELAFNKAAAPEIYQAVHSLTRQADGDLTLDGSGQAVESVLEMRRFADDALLAAHPERIDGELAEALGRTIAGFHASAPLRPAGGARSMAFTVATNGRLLADLRPELGGEAVDRLIALTEAEVVRQSPLLDARTDQGFSRRCHGDLHLGNILLQDGRPVLFDCIEFNDLLSDIDVLYDVAFLLMDLEFRGRREAAARALSAYLDQAARDFPETIWEGLAALPLMLSVRAAVRAHVQAHSHDLGGAEAYLAAAIAHLSPAPPVLAAVGGLSGSGKSTFARAIAPALGASPGAVVLRTDEIRKRLAGAGPRDPLPREIYTPAFYTRVYDTLFAEAGAMLRAGRAVVLDATFIEPELRRRAEDLARATGAPFRPAFLDAPRRVLEARVRARTGDASDANLEVLRGQIDRLASAAVDWPRAKTGDDVSAAAQGWLWGR